MNARVKRSERGWRCAEDHQHAKVPDAIVVRARDLYEFEHVMPAEIARRLGVELGLPLSRRTVQDWVYYVRRNVTPREREQ